MKAAAINSQEIRKNRAFIRKYTISIPARKRCRK